MNKIIKVFAPATVANVACGFDILGFAVSEPGDEVIVQKRKESGVIITNIIGDDGRLPKDPQKNTAGVSVTKFLEAIQAREGVEIELHKKMPLGSGLGSSAASSVASVFAANLLFGEPLSRQELLPFTLEGERVACGAAHADNVAPALFGGFVLIRSYDPLDVIAISTPENLFCTLVHPHIEVRTEDARKILKKGIRIEDAIVQWGNIAGLIAGLIKEDYELIRRSLQDVIIEPMRSMLIPEFDRVKKAAIDSDALGCSIAGSGPSMFALSTSRKLAETIGQSMQQPFTEVDILSDLYISKINHEGPHAIL